MAEFNILRRNQASPPFLVAVSKTLFNLFDVHNTVDEQNTKRREGVGVEPTAADFAPPATGVEDQGAHRDTCLPKSSILPPVGSVQGGRIQNLGEDAE